MSPFGIHGAPAAKSAHGSSHDEIGGGTEAIFTTEADAAPSCGHDYVGLRLVAPVEAPRLTVMVGWPWFFKPSGGMPGSDMKSGSHAAILCGGFRITADKQEDTR